MKILLADDERELLYPTQAFLTHKGFTVDTATDGREACTLIDENMYDCVVLDIMMPYMDGLELLRHMRKNGNTTPTVLLTAKNGTNDRIDGLDAGADDYLSKPISLAELSSRIHALIRRNTLYDTDVFTCGGFSFSRISGELKGATSSVRLSSGEQAVLQILLRGSGRFIAKTHLLDSVNHISDHIDLDTLEIYIAYLQKKLKATGSGAIINEATDKGYCIEAVI